MTGPPTRRYRAAVAVYALLRRDDGHLLLLRRAGSGFHDGELSLPAGHVDEGEDALSAVIREVAEELRVRIQPTDCALALTGHSAPERPGDDAYVDLFFTVQRWSGEPVIGEPETCSELVWVPEHDLPGDVVPYVADAVQAIIGPTDVRLLRWHWPGGA
ncbi:MAG TPA: NUDIX domain-containing protein [Propionibacteriaceae bacterium]|nr:NUDIX domain-containing protein [Propionibacteriaceae bacterium]